jgi:peptidoglycan/xylan/chitin deacetylase (PgdA/CDA1 family)
MRVKMLDEIYGINVSAEYPEMDRQALNLDELMAMNPVVNYGSHTMYHPVLTTCDEEECVKEIELSKNDLEGLLGVKCKHFSYPNGDYTEEVIAMVEKAGYSSGRTTDIGRNDVNTNPFRLKITGITDDASVNIVIAQLTGIATFVRYALRGSFNGKKPIVGDAK